MPFDYAQTPSPAPRNNADTADAPARRDLAGLSYAEGAAALSPRVQKRDGAAKGGQTEADKKKKEQERAAAAKAKYESLLGSWLGGKLYEAVSKELSADKLLGHGQKGVDGALEALTGLINPVEGFGAMDEKAEADAVQKFADALGKWASEEAAEWLKGSDGQAFRTKINHWFEGNPGWVVAIAMVAAAGAVAANVDIPELKQKLKLGDDVTLSAGLDLNKIRDIAFKGASLGVQYAKDGFKAGVEYSYEAGDTDKHTVKGNVGTENNNLTTTAAIQGDKLVVDAKGAHKGDGYQASAGAKHTSDGDDKSTVANVSLTVGDKKDNVTGAATYDVDTGALGINLSSLRTFDTLTLRNSVGYDTDKGHTAGAGVDLQLAEKFKLALDYKLSERQGSTLSAKGSKEWGEGTDQYSLTGSGTYDFESGRVSTAKLGFSWRDKEEFKAVALSLEHKYQNVPTTTFNLLAETTFNDVMFRFQNNTSVVDGRFGENVASAHAAYALNEDWTVFAGGKYGVQAEGVQGLNDKSRGAWAEGGVQFRGVALGVGYRPEDNAVSFGITIPFGR